MGLLAPGDLAAWCRQGLEQRARMTFAMTASAGVPDVPAGPPAALVVAIKVAGGIPLEQADLARMAQGADHPLTAALLGGPRGPRWATAQLRGMVPSSEVTEPISSQVTAAPRDVESGSVRPTVRRPNLKRMSQRLAAADRDLRRQLSAASQQALAHALGHAHTKARARAAARLDRGSKAQRASVTACAAELEHGYLSPAVLAAAGVTQDELFHRAWDAYAATAGATISSWQARRRRIVTRELGLEGEPDWGMEEERRSRAAIAILIGGLAATATDLLARPDRGDLPELGEIPTFDLVPPALVRDAGRALLGQPTYPAVDVGRDIPVGRLPDPPDPLVDAAVREVVPGEVLITQTWIHGDPARPFPPHEALDGVEFDDTNRAELLGKSPDEFPYGNDEYFPGDHGGPGGAGCSCEITNGWDVFDE